MKKFTCFISSCYSLLFILFSSSLLYHPLLARDINLDEIYLTPSSLYITKILMAKLDAYFTVGSYLIDRHVSFSGWIADNKIAYLKEIPNSKTNILMIFDTNTKTKSELVRITGDVMYATVFPGGKFMGMKLLLAGKNIVPDPFIAVVDLTNGQKKLYPSTNPLLDFTISPEGTSMLKYSQQGIVAFDILSETEKTVLGKSILPLSNHDGETVLAYPTENHSKWAILSGGGGNYRLWISEGNKFKELQHATSSTELFWIDSNTIVFRIGTPGYFRGMMYNAKNNKYRPITAPSYHTSLRYFPSSKILSWLHDGIIQFYKIDQNTTISTGLEGDDVALDSVGSRFISTLSNRLFLTNIHSLRGKNIELARIQRNIVALYREVGKRHADHQNEFSAMYLERKILRYEELLKVNNN